MVHTATTDYIFAVYSCKKNITKSNAIYNLLVNKLKNTKPYIIYGDNAIEQEYTIIDDKYIVLKVNDGYDDLMNKTLSLIKASNELFPNSKGMFKCDDDVIVNIHHINNFIQLIKVKKQDYCGRAIIRTKEYNTWSIQNKIDIHPVEECSYCGGPLYFLSKKAIECFNMQKVKKIYYEDMMVGYHLNKFNIFPNAKYNLYSDQILDSPLLSYHNQKHFNELYVVIQGGLGNQLFQIAAAMQAAKKYNKHFTFNQQLIIPNQHQQHNISTTINTLQNIFPQVPWVNIENQKNDYFMFHENKNDCFLHTDKIEKCLDTYNNVVLKGYFINNKYISTDFNKINIKPIDKKLLTIDFTNVYFIHIRLGDYLKTEMYNINLANYYNFCIDRIIHLNPKAIFYICTNQYDEVLSNIINNFPANIKYIIQDKNNNGMDTLYIMSACCGAICSNSTLSFMGAVFQKKKNKENIYMPYPFVKFIDGFNASNIPINMYPNWCTIFNTLNGTLLT